MTWTASSALRARKPFDIPEYQADDPSFDADTLAHHGVKGQKKGVRRYQYPDGSYTPLGREHYGIGPARGSGSDGNNFVSMAKQGKVSYDNIPNSKLKSEFEKACDRYADASERAAAFENEFWNLDFETQKKYATKSAEEAWKDLDEGIRKEWSKQEWIDFYVYEDGDQGPKTALDYWAEDDPNRKKQYDKVNLEYKKAAQARRIANEALTKEIIGNHSGEHVKTENGDSTVDKIVWHTLLKEENRRENIKVKKYYPWLEED